MTGFKSRARRVDPLAVRRAGLALLLSIPFAGPPAAAEIYRCTGPDGATVFTSDRAACPGAEPHASERELQRVPGGSSRSPEPDAPAPAARSGAPPAAPSDDAQAAVWRRKRSDAEAELRDLDRNYDELGEIVTWCNRGGDLVVEDQVGVRKDYSCDEAHESYERATERRKELKHYLTGGLEDECRRAGCMPGWVR